jgi:hypothetical protein
MSTQVKVIICNDKVYATYHKTICFRADLKDLIEDESGKENHKVVKDAKACAFSYACGFGSVLIEMVKLRGNKTDSDILEYLERCSELKTIQELINESILFD